ncbi:hypothetical protein [Nocardia sp. NPDC046763]|uniref:hypothetical protein n=1 Tax=Nocardia sp. NPDC046763 TaxID=3155256 RepID=UPI0033F5FC94
MTTPAAQIPVSTVPAVKAFLFQQISASVTPNPNPSFPLLVTYDQPGTNQPAEIVVVGSTRHRTAKPFQMVGSGGHGWLYEEYELELEIAVFHGGDDAQGCYERAYSILGQIEAVIRSDPSLGGRVVVAHPATTRDTCTWEQEHKGRLVVVELTVNVSAQI